jgi:hypothetical protein
MAQQRLPKDPAGNTLRGLRRNVARFREVAIGASPGYVTLAATKKAGESTSEMCRLFVDGP